MSGAPLAPGPGTISSALQTQTEASWDVPALLCQPAAAPYRSVLAGLAPAAHGAGARHYLGPRLGSTPTGRPASSSRCSPGSRSRCGPSAAYRGPPPRPHAVEPSADLTARARAGARARPMPAAQRHPRFCARVELPGLHQVRQSRGWRRRGVSRPRPSVSGGKGRARAKRPGPVIPAAHLIHA